MPKSKDNAPIEVVLSYHKDTKNTYQFVNDDDKAAVSALYVKKSAMDGKVGDGTKITLSITAS